MAAPEPKAIADKSRTWLKRAEDRLDKTERGTDSEMHAIQAAALAALASLTAEDAVEKKR